MATRLLAILAAAYWLTVGGGCSTSIPANVEVGPCDHAATVFVYFEHPEDGTLTLFREVEGGTGQRFSLPPGQYRFVGQRFDIVR